MAKFGRKSIFREKVASSRVQGLMTKVGSTRFEAARRRLAALADRTPAGVSDGDTIEYMARGDADTRAYLKRQSEAG